MVSKTSLEINRSGVWEIRWTEGGGDTGTPSRSRSLSTRKKALVDAEKVRSHFLAAEADADAISASGDTLEDVLSAYGKHAEAKGVGNTQQICLNHLRSHLGALRPAEVTPTVLQNYRVTRGVADGTLRRELNVLKTALTWGAKHHKVAAVPVVDLPPNGLARAVFLDEKIESELFALAIGDIARGANAVARLSRIGRFIAIGLDTGARKSAILGLTWDRVDLKNWTVDFRDTSRRVTKKRRVVTFIPTRLRPVFERAWSERWPEAKYVLDHDGDIQKAWGVFMNLHGFESVTPHVLRHTRITLLLRGGASVWDVSALVGASPDVIHEVYGHHVADNRLRAQADRRAA